MKEHQTPLLSIQALRGAAALLVVFFHLRIVEAKYGGVVFLPRQPWPAYRWAWSHLAWGCGGWTASKIRSLALMDMSPWSGRWYSAPPAF